MDNRITCDENVYTHKQKRIKAHKRSWTGRFSIGQDKNSVHATLLWLKKKSALIKKYFFIFAQPL